jgi:8-oxo-dGTP pyrophosphatase MutT (NUDIX family)
VTLPTELRRLAYRGAHTALRGYWFVRRPEVEGVKCVLTSGERVLLVRHTYGRRNWDLPGGTVKRGEPPATAAQREMREELGVDIHDWTPLGPLFAADYHRRDRMHCFQAELEDPRLTVNDAELAAVAWFTRSDLPPDLSDNVRQILGRVAEHDEHRR